MEDQRRVSRIESEEELEIDLGRVFLGMWKLFRRLWWMVLLLILAGAALFTLYQRLGKKPLYASSATFTVETGNETSGTYGFYYNQETADQLSKTFPYVLESGFFRNMLLEHLGSDSLNGIITAETIESSNVVTIAGGEPGSAGCQGYPGCGGGDLPGDGPLRAGGDPVPDAGRGGDAVRALQPDEREACSGYRRRSRACAGPFHPGASGPLPADGPGSGGDEADHEPALPGHDPVHAREGAPEPEAAEHLCAGRAHAPRVPGRACGPCGCACCGRWSRRGRRCLW